MSERQLLEETLESELSSLRIGNGHDSTEGIINTAKAYGMKQYDLRNSTTPQAKKELDDSQKALTRVIHQYTQSAYPNAHLNDARHAGAETRKKINQVLSDVLSDYIEVSHARA